MRSFPVVISLGSVLFAFQRIQSAGGFHAEIQISTTRNRRSQQRIPLPPRTSSLIATSVTPSHHPQQQISNDHEHDRSKKRRQLLQFSSSFLAACFLPAQPAHAGQVGARITQAVTQSDLGVSVRRSVVRGAQVMDQLDGRWEQFSDRLGLGEARSKQEARPKPKVIPDPLPLDAAVATKMLGAVDQAFLSVTGISSKVLSQKQQALADLVRPSFERSGSVSLDGPLETAEQFNFWSYVHFKAFGDLLIEEKKNVSFPSFRAEFDRQVGQQLVALLLPNDASLRTTSPSAEGSTGTKLKETLKDRLSAVSRLSQVLQEKGLVAATELSAVDPERLADWAEDLSDLQLSLALDGDVTLQSQILLQEQGFRLYPSYAKLMVAKLLQIKGQQVTVEEYYMDTDYNSDPNKFEVKEVLLNIVLESV